MAKLSEVQPALSPTGAIDADIVTATSGATCIRLISVDGTEYFIFPDNSGDLRISTTLPTTDTAGTVVGTQS